MKKIQIVHYTTPQKKGNFVKYNKYQVYLGNENFEYFTNIKDCKKYLTEANKFLNYKMFEINSLISDCYVYYRSFWFKFYDMNGRNNYSLERDVKSNLDSADLALESAWQKCKLTNGNLFAFDFQFKALNNLLNVIQALKILARQKNLQDDLQKLEVIKQRCIRVESTLRLYPNTEQTAENVDYSYMKIV